MVTVRLPWPDNEFSAVSCNCLYCVAEAERAVAEMYRVLHPRGRLVLATDFHADPAAARQQEPTTPAPPSPPRSSPGSRRARQARHGPTQRIRTWPHASCRTYDDECACWHPHRYAQAQRPHFGMRESPSAPGAWQRVLRRARTPRICLTACRPALSAQIIRYRATSAHGTDG